MPAVEISFAAPSAGGADAFDAPSFSDTADGQEDFDSVMQAKLSPHSNKSQGKISPHTDKSPVAAESALTAETPPTETQTASDKDSAKLVGDEKKPATSVDGKITNDQNSPFVPLDAAAPLPVYFSLPLFAGSTGASLPTSLPTENADTSGTADGELAGVQALACSGSLATPGTPKRELQLPAASTNAASVSSPTQKDHPANAAELDAKPENPAPGTATTAGLLKMVSPGQNAALPNSKETPQPVISTATTAALVTSAERLPAKDASATPLTVAQFPAMPAATAETAAASAQKPAEIQPAQNHSENPPTHDSSQAGTPVADSGTGVATGAVDMKNPQKTIKVAGPDAKVLPVGDNGGAGEKNLPMPRPASAARAADNRGSDSNFSFAGGGQSPFVDRASTLNVLELPSLAEARMRGVDRTHDMIALHSMRLVESKTDTLAVVIKPSVGTELFLELRQRNGGVEAHATLTRGDHQFLSQHWPELQQRLEQRGIKLAPLGSETSFSASDNGQFQRQQTSQEEAAQQAAAFAEFASIAPVGGAGARLAVARDGWESWA